MSVLERFVAKYLAGIGLIYYKRESQKKYVEIMI